jgi:hypothetical protein
MSNKCGKILFNGGALEKELFMKSIFSKVYNDIQTSLKCNEFKIILAHEFF